MLQYFFPVAMFFLFACSSTDAKANNKNSFLFPINAIADTSKPVKTAAKNNASTSWDVFWKDFTIAINTKDTTKIAALTSKDFYDGGGSTIQQWLQSDVYANDKTFAAFNALLKKGVKNFKRFDSSPYKATGKNKSGDLFFEYKKGKWLFGGIVGD